MCKNPLQQSKIIVIIIIIIINLYLCSLLLKKKLPLQTTPTDYPESVLEITVNHQKDGLTPFLMLNVDFQEGHDF